MSDLYHLLTAIPFPCFIFGTNNEIERVNPAAEVLFQRSEKALKNETIEHIFSNCPAVVDLFRTALTRHTRVREMNIEIRFRNHASSLVSVDLNPMENDRWLMLIISPAKEMQSIRTQGADSGAGSLTTMASMLAHEIKNPLAAIRGAAQLMTKHNPDLVELIVGETARITSLLDTMELFSSPEEVDLGPVNIHEILDEVCQLGVHSFGQHIHFLKDYDPSLPRAQGNAGILHRIFLNLIKNACEACLHGQAQIQLKTRYEFIHRRQRLDGERLKANIPLVISLIDNGPGIAPERHRHIFKAFFSTKDQGRGLGLAYVAEAVANLNGSIDLLSVPGRTEFRLRLPEA